MYCGLSSCIKCFNSLDALTEVLSLSLNYISVAEPLYEQGGLCMRLLGQKYTNRTVDHPYTESKVVYNVRSKGNNLDGHVRPFQSTLDSFYVTEHGLFTGDGKQIKVWHYCESFGSIPIEQMENRLNEYSQSFNKATINYFTKICNNK